VLLPSAYRPLLLERCLNSLFENLPNCETRVVVSVMYDDLESVKVVSRFPVVYAARVPYEYERGAIYGWNKCLAQEPLSDLYSLSSDDVIYHSGWHEQSLSLLDGLGGYGLIGYNDTYSDGNIYAGHFLVSRDFLIDQVGGCIYPPLYKSWWCDREISDIAQNLGCYAWSTESIVRHCNYEFVNAHPDQVSLDAYPLHEDDHQLYLKRKSEGFPTTWQPILKRQP
jgi:hypothetical protein